MVYEYKTMIIFISYKSFSEKVSGKWSVFWICATVGKGGVNIWKTEGLPNAFYECNLITKQVFSITKMINYSQCCILHRKQSFNLHCIQMTGLYIKCNTELQWGNLQPVFCGLVFVKIKSPEFAYIQDFYV